MGEMVFNNTLKARGGLTIALQLNNKMAVQGYDQETIYYC